MKKREGEEALRLEQQGKGRPVISATVGERRFVAVGNTLYHSKSWKTFSDFLQTYIKLKLGSDWGNAEIAKPLAERHTLLQWYDELSRQQLDHVSFTGVVHSMPMTGAVVCYVGLAYNLYLLEHNVELQERYVSRLKNFENFQGVYYELMIASILIRAGFRLELEDETDQQSKHCEFSAVSLTTGRKYWVEAKMRSVEGRFGKSSVDGVPNTVADPTTRLTKHISDALKKPASDERLIFVDLNAEVKNDAGIPSWLEQAVRRLDARERDLIENQKAYVFVTNLPFHVYLAGNSPGRQALGYGLGISDFSKPGAKTLIQMYSEKQKHLDAHEIMDAIKEYPVFPDTFDGALVSDSFDRNIKIGETYQFTDMGAPPGTIGTVTDAIVMEAREIAYVVIRTKDGRKLILEHPLTRAQLDDYRKHKDTFFGVKKDSGRQINDPFEIFEWLLTTYKKSSKEKLLEFLGKAPDIELLRSLSQEELALIYCERMTAQFLNDTKKTGDGK